MLKKYFFYYEDDKIFTYLFSGTEFELKRNDGEDWTTGSSLNDSSFTEWLTKTVSETSDDFIDFCVLSDRKIPYDYFVDEKNKKWKKQGKSTWTLKDISAFLNVFFSSNFNCGSFDLIMTDNGDGINIGNETERKKLYLKCFPEFDFDDKEKMTLPSSETKTEKTEYPTPIPSAMDNSNQETTNDKLIIDDNKNKNDSHEKSGLQKLAEDLKKRRLKEQSGNGIYIPKPRKIENPILKNEIKLEAIQLHKIEDDSVEKTVDDKIKSEVTKTDNSQSNSPDAKIELKTNDSKIVDKTPDPSKQQFAVFYDAENIACEFRDAVFGKLSTKGEVIYECAIGDLDMEYTKGWKKYFIEFRHVPHRGRKEQADHVIYNEVHGYVKQNPSVAIVIVSSDGDFALLARDLRGKCTKIIGISETKETTKPEYVLSCTEFFYIEDFMPDYKHTVNGRENKRITTLNKSQNKSCGIVNKVFEDNSAGYIRDGSASYYFKMSDAFDDKGQRVILSKGDKVEFAIEKIYNPSGETNHDRNGTTRSVRLINKNFSNTATIKSTVQKKVSDIQQNDRQQMTSTEERTDLQEKIYSLLLKHCNEKGCISSSNAGEILKNHGINYKTENSNMKLHEYLKDILGISIIEINKDKYIKVEK